jgi:hypothetical protein
MASASKAGSLKSVIDSNILMWVVQLEQVGAIRRAAPAWARLLLRQAQDEGYLFAASPHYVILSRREAARRRTHFAAAASFDTRLKRRGSG